MKLTSEDEIAAAEYALQVFTKRGTSPLTSRNAQKCSNSNYTARPWHISRVASPLMGRGAMRLRLIDSAMTVETAS
jgi:hypothetical protein